MRQVNLLAVRLKGRLVGAFQPTTTTFGHLKKSHNMGFMSCDLKKGTNRIAIAKKQLHKKRGVVCLRKQRLECVHSFMNVRRVASRDTPLSHSSSQSSVMGSHPLPHPSS